jgi:hypothetical protein
MRSLKQRNRAHAVFLSLDESPFALIAGSLPSLATVGRYVLHMGITDTYILGQQPDDAKRGVLL